MSRHVVVNFAILLQIGNVILQHREPQLKTKLSAIVRGPEFAQQVEQWLNRWSQICRRATEKKTCTPSWRSPRSEGQQ